MLTVHQWPTNIAGSLTYRCRTIYSCEHTLIMSFLLVFNLGILMAQDTLWKRTLDEGTKLQEQGEYDKAEKAIKETLAIGYLTHFEWGCKDGVHTGWAILEANDKAEAILSVPTFLRPDARVIMLTRFDPDRDPIMHSK